MPRLAKTTQDKEHNELATAPTSYLKLAYGITTEKFSFFYVEDHGKLVQQTANSSNYPVFTWPLNPDGFDSKTKTSRLSPHVP